MFLVLIFLCLGWFGQQTGGLQLAARLSSEGVHGVVRFSQTRDEVSLTSDLDWTRDDPPPEPLTWSVYQFPVDHRVLNDRCTQSRLGNRIVDLGEVFGPISLNGSTSYISTANVFNLMGESGMWLRSLVVQLGNDKLSCATIMADGSTSLRAAEARFHGGVAGSVTFLWLGSSGATDSAILTDLYRTRRLARQTLHKWKIFSTDVLDSEADKSRQDCNALQVLYQTHEQYDAGDLNTRLGPAAVGTKRSDDSAGSKVFYRSVNITLLELKNRQRHLYLVLYDDHHPDSYMACARIVPWEPTTLRATLEGPGLKGLLSLHQTIPFAATRAYLRWEQRPEGLGGLRIHELPPSPSTSSQAQCRGIGAVFNPSDKPTDADAHIPVEQTQDSYAVGDLSGKVGYDQERRWDVFLPLWGRNSVAHRALVLYRNNDTSGLEEPWICTSLVRFTPYNSKEPMNTAEIIFRYPLAGRIIMRQPRNDWTADTIVLVEQLTHADGLTQTSSRDHRWAVTAMPPGKDFYDWQQRCISAGLPYDPYSVYVENKTAECNEQSPGGICRAGSLSERLGVMSIAGRANESDAVSRRMWVDGDLPLAGPHSVVGRGFVIFGDHGPLARGERLACSKITSVFRRKGVVRDWFGNGQETTVNGKIEFYQQTQYEPTDVEFSLAGLNNMSSIYHITRMPILEELEFPCEESALGTMYDLPGSSSVAVGDLSARYGKLDHHSHLNTAFNDSNLSLFGPHSILGRSVTLYTRGSTRWTCATIERGYAPSEARELRAIASFHHPLGYAWGYMRMTQLIHSDGSASDTVIEVNLKHPGEHDRNFTQNHNWAVYVNPVGVDATVQVLHTRCTAAGYLWNPYYTQLADPLNQDLYRAECGPETPLRCYAGDLSGRLGTIDLGGSKRLFSDSNLPLEGPVSAMGKSIVILDKNRGPDKFACANIQPDKDTIKYVNIRKTPKFIVAQFLLDVRRVMGVPEWLLTVDSRKTTPLHGGACVQLLVHFKGPEANRLEQDFSKLLSTGRLDSPSLNIHGYQPPVGRKTRIGYKLCGADNNKEGAQIFYGGRASGNRLHFKMSVVFVFILLNTFM